MALSYEQFFGTGSQTLFTFAFDYLSRSHVKVSVDGVAVPFTWAGIYTIQLVSPAAANAVVEVRRTTPRDKRLVSFTDGSTLVATDMNTSTLQAFFLSQEAFDQGAASLAVTEDGSYSAQTRRISVVGDPVEPQDVVTKRWAETGMTSTLALTIAARDVAVGARNASQTAATNASADRILAQAARSDAQSARDSASGHRLNAYNAQVATEAARDIVLAARDVTTTARDETLVARSTAVTKAAEAAASAASVDGSNILNKSGNLSGLANLPTARSNLGLGSIATRNLTVSTSAPSGGADGDLWVQV